MTDPTEALFCVKPDGHSGPHAGWIGGEWSVRDNWTDLRHPPIEQASVRPASPDPAEAADEMGGHFGPCCYGSNHQAAEAADREAAGAARDSERTRTSAAVAPLEPIPTDWGVGPLTHPAAVTHDPTICTGTDAVPCGCVCFDCNERGIHQAAEAADAAAEAAYQDSQNTDPQYRPSAAVAPLDVEALRTALDGLDVYAYDRDLHGEPLEINEATHRIAAAYDAIRKRGGA